MEEEKEVARGETEIDRNEEINEMRWERKKRRRGGETEINRQMKRSVR